MGACLPPDLSCIIGLTFCICPGPPPNPLSSSACHTRHNAALIQLHKSSTCIYHYNPQALITSLWNNPYRPSKLPNKPVVSIPHKHNQTHQWSSLLTMAQIASVHSKAAILRQNHGAKLCVQHSWNFWLLRERQLHVLSEPINEQNSKPSVCSQSDWRA